MCTPGGRNGKDKQATQVASSAVHYGTRASRKALYNAIWLTLTRYNASKGQSGGKAKGGKGSAGGTNWQLVQKPTFNKYRNDGGKGSKGKGKGFKGNDKNKGYKGRW
tara:strand:+ start:18 stop:338 length:321 start_codon:yes stop_codon:yes gene_type:complete